MASSIASKAYVRCMLLSLLLSSLWAGQVYAEPEAIPDAVAGYFARGQALLEQGQYAEAVVEFEQVLQFDNLPNGLIEQAEIYAEAARNYAAGKPWSHFAYAEFGGGYDHENTTRTTVPGEAQRDAFGKIRLGAGMGYIIDDGVSLDGNIDYRYRAYDASTRRDDKDWRWQGTLNKMLDNGSSSFGLRGRASYRGADGYRQDYGLFADRSIALNTNNQFIVEGELRRRVYPEGVLRSRSRNIAEFWARWNRALGEGQDDFTLSLNVGREWATHGRLDGDNTFYGLRAQWRVQFNPKTSMFVIGKWEHSAYHEDIEQIYDPLLPPSVYSRSDNLYEVESGLSWRFAPQWSLIPNVLYKRDSSNVFLGAYSATEYRIMLRRAF